MQPLQALAPFNPPLVVSRARFQCTVRVLLDGKALPSSRGAWIRTAIALPFWSPSKFCIQMTSRARDNADVPANMVEATEGMLLNVDKAASHIKQLRQFGIQIAIDDSGTGYSSLSHLGALEADCIKIDKSFISVIGYGVRSGSRCRAHCRNGRTCSQA